MEEELQRADENILLVQSENDSSPESFYYKLNEADLKQLGVSNFEEGTEYIVKYSTREAYKINWKNTDLENVEYVYLK